ncbi:MAG: phospho-sugar mutase [Roseibacillus sp.]
MAAILIIRISMSEWKSRLADAVRAGEVLAESQENIDLLVKGTSDPLAESAISELVERSEWEEINDRFYKTMAFGTGGLRGRTIGKVVTSVEQGRGGPLDRPEFPCVGTASMNYYNLGRAIQGFIAYVRKHLENTGQDRKPVFAFAQDTRHFSNDFAQYCAKVCADLGCDAYLFDGPRATPELSFTLRALRADAGVVITASHNPPHDNGFKAYFNDGGQIVEPHASGIIAEVNALASDNYEPLPEDQRGKVEVLGVEMDEQYKAKLRTILLRPDLLEGRSAKVVYTNLHGTGGWIVVPMLREMGFEVLTVPEQDEQDGRFPTVASPNPENASALQMAIDLAQAEGADAAIGTDPDCDRMGVAVRNADGEMQLLSGNQIGTLMAWYRIKTFFEQGIITESNRSRATLTKTFVTTEFQTAVAQRFGIGVVNTLTGFKFIGEKLRKYEDAIPADKRGDYRSLSEEETRALRLEYSKFFVFGGEESYGYLGGDFVRDKDGNGSAVMFAELAAYAMSEGKMLTDLLDDLYREFGVYDEMNTNIVLEGAEGAVKIAALTLSYSENLPTEIDGSAVVKVQDFNKEDIYDEEGDLIPKAGMIVVQLEDGRRFAVRPSGTEPKIKYYLFGKDAPGADDLAASKARVIEGLEALWSWLEADAYRRMDAVVESVAVEGDLGRK